MQVDKVHDDGQYDSREQHQIHGRRHDGKWRQVIAVRIRDEHPGIHRQGAEIADDLHDKLYDEVREDCARDAVLCEELSQ